MIFFIFSLNKTMEVRMELSPKQMASIKKGRKVRVSKKHMSGSGIALIVRPETFNRMNRSFALDRGIDLSLDPEELQATMKGGKINFLNKAKRWTGFIGDTLNGIAQSEFIKPILQAGTQRAVAAVNPQSAGMDMFKQATDLIRPSQAQSTPSYNTFKAADVFRPSQAQSTLSSGYDTYKQAADIFRPTSQVQPSLSQYLSKFATGQNIDYLKRGALEAAQANSYRPFSAPSPMVQSMIGTVTDD